MTLIYVLSVYAVYLLIILVIAYYARMLSSKTEFTRQELTDITPLVKTVQGKLTMKYNPSFVIILMLISSLLGILFSHLPHWFFQSALLTIVIFIVLPQVQKHFQDRMVIASSEFSDTAANIFAKYCEFIILGYGTGFGAGFMYYWNATHDMFFLWFAVNILLVTGLMVVTAKAIITDKASSTSEMTE
jgi:hypothetical protein